MTPEIMNNCFSPEQKTFFANHKIKRDQITHPDSEGTCIIPDARFIWAGAPAGNIWVYRDGSAVIEANHTDFDPDHYLVLETTGETTQWLDMNIALTYWAETAEGTFNPNNRSTMEIANTALSNNFAGYSITTRR